MSVNNNLVAKKNQRLGLTAYLTNDAVKNQINNVIGGKNGQRFISSIVSAVNVNPALQECTNQSILSAALLGESLNLSPSPQLGHYYMVPFKDNKQGVTVAQFQIGYKGLIQLAIRSGMYKKLNVIAIKEGELKSFDALNEEIDAVLITDEAEREKAPTIGYYAMFEYTNGFRKAIYWSKEKMEAHALKYSKGYQAKKGYTFWEKDFDGMAFKTMLRQLISKWGIMSIDMQKAFEEDFVEEKEKDFEYVSDEAIAEEAVVEEEAIEVPKASEPAQASAEKPSDPRAALFN